MLSRMPGKPLTEQEIALLWSSDKAGESQHGIGRILGRTRSSAESSGGQGA